MAFAVKLAKTVFLGPGSGNGKYQSGVRVTTVYYPVLEGVSASGV